MNDAQQLELVYQISNLLYKYIFREIDNDEMIALYEWVYSSPVNKELFEEIANPTTLSESLIFFSEITKVYGNQLSSFAYIQ